MRSATQPSNIEAAGTSHPATAWPQNSPPYRMIEVLLTDFIGADFDHQVGKKRGRRGRPTAA